MRRSGWAAVAFLCLVPVFGCGAPRQLRPRQIGDFEQPIYITSSPSDPDRLLVAEREGQILEVIPQGRRQLADLSGLIACCESERGLLDRSDTGLLQQRSLLRRVHGSARRRRR